MTSQIETSVWTGNWKAAVGAALFAFLAAAIVIGTGGYLTNPGASLILPIGVTAVVPVALFLATFAASARFRGFVLAQDPRILTMMHLWRVVGFIFLLLYAVDTLPAVFAIPAGVVDVAIGVAAIFIVARMERDPSFVRSKGFARFHLLGLLDFAVAVGTSGLAAGAIPGLVPGGVTSAAMDVWPLNFFPSFIVPLFIILHLTVLLKIRALRRGAGETAGAEVVQ